MYLMRFCFGNFLVSQESEDIGKMRIEKYQIKENKSRNTEIVSTLIKIKTTLHIINSTL